MKPLQTSTKCHQIEIHYKRPLLDDMPILRHTKDTMNFIKQNFELQKNDFKECFWVILTTTANSVLGFAKTSEGTTKKVFMNIREIIQLALLSNATGIILVHNHPSGKLNPSDVDINQTHLCKTMLCYLEIELLDHIIITRESHYSFKEHDLLP